MPTSPALILVVSPDPALAATLDGDHLPPGVRLESRPDAPSADAFLATTEIDVLVCDDALPGEPGLMLAGRHARLHPRTRIVLVCAPLEPALFVKLLNDVRGLYCQLTPWQPAQLRAVVARALTESRELRHASATSPQRLVTAWVAALPRLAALALLTGGAILLCGLLALAALYLLKTLVGIDLVSEGHLSDLWR
jgi:CheY-like chemotaxis protein